MNQRSENRRDRLLELRHAEERPQRPLALTAALTRERRELTRRERLARLELVGRPDKRRRQYWEMIGHGGRMKRRTAIRIAPKKRTKASSSVTRPRLRPWACRRLRLEPSAACP